MNSGDILGLDRIIGKSPELMRCISLARRVAEFPVNVLIIGDSGTGKELFADAIHRLSGRRAGPFVAVDCASYPAELVESELFGYVRGAFTGAIRDKPGRIELAEGGTLFIDEIGNLSPAVQVKLLRVLQERRICRLGTNEGRPVDLRLICATNVNLGDAIAAGRFRADLYHRINEFFLMLPPLRDRGDDIGILANFFLYRFNRQFSKEIPGFDDAALARLNAYPWPGNIRELQSAVKHSVVLSQGRIGVSALPEEVACFRAAPQDASAEQNPDFLMPEGVLPLWDARSLVAREVEKRSIHEALVNFRYDRARTAEALGIHPKTLGRKIKEQGIV
jgi:transcriptional regulator with PAS, ATPase and Fis domain